MSRLLVGIGRFSVSYEKGEEDGGDDGEDQPNGDEMNGGGVDCADRRFGYDANVSTADSKAHRYWGRMVEMTQRPGCMNLRMATCISSMLTRS